MVNPSQPVIVRLVRVPCYATVMQCFDHLSFQQPHLHRTRTPGRSCVSILYRWEHAQALSRRRVISMLRSLSAVVAPPKYTNSVVCLYTWLAALIV